MWSVWQSGFHERGSTNLSLQPEEAGALALPLMKLKDYEIVLHLGLPKTGTTALQTHLFPKLKGVRYFGVKHPRREEQNHGFDQVRAFVLFGKGKLEEMRALVDKEVHSNSTLLISEEEIMIGSLPGGHQGDAVGTSWKIKLIRLASLFEGRKVLTVVTLRSFKQGVFSYYCELYPLLSGQKNIPYLIKQSDLFGIWRFNELEEAIRSTFGNEVCWRSFPDNLSPKALEEDWGLDQPLSLPQTNRKVKTSTHVIKSRKTGFLLEIAHKTNAARLRKILIRAHHVGLDWTWNKQIKIPLWGPGLWDAMKDVESAAEEVFDRVCSLKEEK